MKVLVPVVNPSVGRLIGVYIVGYDRWNYVSCDTNDSAERQCGRNDWCTLNGSTFWRVFGT